MTTAVALTCVIPCYNEQHGLAATVAAVTAALVVPAITWELLLVDDGSTDETWAVIRAASERWPYVRGLRLNGHFGQHQALMAGLQRARGEAVVFIDADLQTPVDDLLRLLPLLPQVELVLSRRVRRQDALARRLASRLLAVLFTAAGVAYAADCGCMLMAFNRSLAERLLRYNRPGLFIPIAARRLARSCAVVPVGHEPRRGTRSRYTAGRLVGLLCTALGERCRRYSASPAACTVPILETSGNDS